MNVTLLRIFRGPSHLAKAPVVAWRLDMRPEDSDVVAKQGWDMFRRAFPRSEAHRGSAEPVVAVALLIAVWARELLNANHGLIDAAGARAEASGEIIGWCGHRDAELGVGAVRIACALIVKAAGKEVDQTALDRMTRALVARAAIHHPKRSAMPMAKAAKARRIPFEQSPLHPSLWCYGWGRAGRTLAETSSFEDSYLGQWIARNKRLSRQYLHGLGFPASEHDVAADAEDAVAIAARLGGPVVVKPADRGKGRGVTAGISREADVRAAFTQARAWSSRILVERFVPGHDHRLLVIGGGLVAAARREAATVTGDGRRSVRQLIGAIDAKRAAESARTQYLLPILVDDTAIEHLGRQGAGLDTVPGPGVTLSLRGNANISSGGCSTDVLDHVHPDVRAMAECIARNIGVHALGIDYITTDISRSWRESGGTIIEANIAPGIKMHIASGVAEELIGSHVLGPDVGRIPVAVVIAPAADQSELLRELHGILNAWAPGWRCGVMGGGELRVGNVTLAPAGPGDHAHVRQLLQNRDCDAALLCVTAESVLETGFPVDHCQLAVAAGTPSLLGLVRNCADVALEAPANGNWRGSDALKALIGTLGPPLARDGR